MKKKMEMKKELQILKNNAQKFSITVDEWSDNRMRRYMNVTLLSTQKKHVLGLVPIEGSCNSEKSVELVRNFLQQFDIDLNTDIVASTHDGAAVMVKYGRLIGAISQLCYNHAMHLAVLELVYKKTNSEMTDYSDEDTYEPENDLDENEDEIESLNENNFYIDGNLNFEQDNDILVIPREDLGKILSETRTTINFFKNSCVRNSILQKHIKAQEGKSLSLLLDCRTRWNSQVAMIKRFLRVKDSINKALGEIGTTKINDENIKILQEMLFILEPMELGVNELGKNNTNLLKAEAIIMYILQKLKDINTEMSLNLFQILKRRIEERRNKGLISLMSFLKNCTYPKAHEFLSYTSKSDISLLASEIYNRLFTFGENNITQQEILNVEEKFGDSESEPESEYTKMQKTIDSFLMVPQPSTSSSSNLKKYFKIAEGTGQRSKELENLYQALLTIQPTSTNSERAFSTSGNFMTKIRSRLNTDTLNALVFLKFYFNKD